MKLNMILITSPELAEFRRRLKSLETRVRHVMLCAFFEKETDARCSKMVKRCLRRSTARGVIMP